MTSSLRPDDLRQAVVADPEACQRFLTDGGVLDLPVDLTDVQAIRLELQEPAPQCLHLQTLGVETRDHASSSKLARSASITSSSRYPAYASKFVPAKFLDFEHTHGTQVHTEGELTPWIEVALDTPVDVSRLRIRNVSNGTCGRAMTLKVSVWDDPT